MIPLKIETLLEGKVVERNRVEYKKGWNPEDTIHAICAFANDYANVNGGYIVIGIEAQDGIPLLPPVGIESNRLDEIQQKIIEYCNHIEPHYFPSIEVIDYPDKDTHLIYLKCPSGDAGPYRAPRDIYGKNKDKKLNKEKVYWIRPSALTMPAQQSQIAELFEKFNSVPFDDRVHRKAKIDIIRRAYVEDYLIDSNSSLAEGMNNQTLEDLLLSLGVANETDTGLELRNIAILMFSDRPEKWIPGAQINLVRFFDSDAEAGDNFGEKAFTGPIWKQVRDVLDYFTTNIITERVNKIDGRAEVERTFNYPYNALEEAIVNAVFHKSYRDSSPVEIRIYIDEIKIINYPGPDGYIDMKKFSEGKARTRKYRNRRIGEFFKELDLSEKQSTGIPKILKSLKDNGSPMPLFETDENRTFLETTIRIREEEAKVSSKTNYEVINMLAEFLKQFSQKYSLQFDGISSELNKLSYQMKKHNIPPSDEMKELLKNIQEVLYRSAESAEKSAESAESAEKSADFDNSVDTNKILSKRHQQILELMESNREYSAQEIAEQMNLKGPRIRQLLKELVDMNILEITAATKNRRYRIKRQINE